MVLRNLLAPARKTRSGWAASPGAVRSFGYDAAGQMMSATNPLGSVPHFDYDQDGAVTELE